MNKELYHPLLKKAVQAFAQFSEQDADVIANYFRDSNLEKGSYLIQEGMTCQSISLLAQGSMRQYQISDNGDEQTQGLFVEGDWVMEYRSLTSQKPAASRIQAVEDGIVLTLTVHDFHKLIKLSDRFFQLGRVFQFAGLQQELHLQDSSPQQRYLTVLNTRPEIIQRFPLKYIASYLRMTPETLSRVRRNIG